MFIPDPGSQIQKQQQKRSVEKNLLSYLFCSHKFHKIVNYLFFEMLKKKFGLVFKELYNLLLKKFSLCSQKYGFWIRDPRSGQKPIPDPGSRGQKETASRIRIRNTDLYWPEITLKSARQRRHAYTSILHRKEISKALGHSALKKKWLAIFPSPAGMPPTKLSLAGNNLTIPGRGEFGY
jgi:hypothetical protein